MLSTLTSYSAALFRPIRRLVGPLHRRRGSLSDEQLERERRLPPLPPPWSDDDRWYPGGSPPSLHNHLTPLPHGDSYFADLCREVASAQHRVTICGWCLTPLMSLRQGAASILADVLREVSNHAEVYVLLWSGAPGLFEPSVHQTKDVVRILRERAPRVRCRLDRTASFSHDHHQKAVTIDGRIAYVGGMDLTTFQGDRWDTAEHALRFGVNWHDVQLRLQGETVWDVEENFCERWNAVTKEQLQPIAPESDPAWGIPAQVVRTIPAGFYGFAPHGEFGIRHALIAGIRQAKKYVYLENQYIWAPEIVDALCDAMERNRGRDFRIVMVLPEDAISGKYDNDEHVRQLRKADPQHQMFEAYSLYATGPASSVSGYQYRPIYVHAKVAIVDDEWFMVGSANLNRRGMATDSEIAVQSVAPEIARALRVRLWSEHLGIAEEQVAGKSPSDVIDHEWKAVATAMGQRMAANGPPGAGQIRRYEQDSHPVGLLLDWLQSATLEH